MMMAMLAIATMGSTALAQQTGIPARHENSNYFVVTRNVKEIPSQATTPTHATTDAASAEEIAEKRRKDFISRNFRYVSMCDWTPGMRFMVRPTQKDLVVRTFADAKTGNMVSTRSLANSVLVYEGHENPNGMLHEQVIFSLEDNPHSAITTKCPRSPSTTTAMAIKACPPWPTSATWTRPLTAS